MTESAGKPTSATADRSWRVEVTMPEFPDGRFAGWPVGWQSLNQLPSGIRSRARADGGPPARLGKIDWDRARKAWRVAAYEALVAAAVPRNLGRVEISIELRFPDRAERDPGNYEPTIKACIDAVGPQKIYRNPRKKTHYGIVVELGRGVIPTDAPRCLVRPNATVGEPLGRTNPIKGVVVMTIRQLPAEEAT